MFNQFLRRFVRLAFATVLTGSAAFAQAAAAQSGPQPDYTGFYVMSEVMGARKKDEIPAGIYDLKGVTGVHIRLSWDKLEPSKGRFRWDDLDREAERALKSGKKIVIGVLAGSASPRWLRDEGVKTSSFIIGKGGGDKRSCKSVEVPWPWDAGYQSAYIEMMAAISRRLKETGAYASVTIVKLTGISQASQELRMPAGDGTLKMRGKHKDPCQPSNATETWLDAGYRPSKIVNAWVAMAKGVEAAFPEKLLAQSILDSKGFPEIGEDGATGVTPTIKDQVISQGIKLFPGRFAVQWNGLKPEGKISQSVLDAKAEGAIIGWQTNHYRGKKSGAGCNAERSPKPKPCSNTEYRAMLLRGIEAGGKYIEIWIPDALKFDAELSAALPDIR